MVRNPSLYGAPCKTSVEFLEGVVNSSDILTKVLGEQKMVPLLMLIGMSDSVD